MQVDQYDLSTVVNKGIFIQTVELRQCELEGRSLVTKKPLNAGDIILVEQPRLRYLIEPTCRSSLSPYYSKRLWKQLKESVVDKDLELTPGVPAAMLAYLALKDRSSYDFFYYPDLDQDHTTVQSVKEACTSVVATVPEFKDLDAKEMATFILKIYGNAHTVSFAHERKQPTHKRRKERRQWYIPKFGEPYDMSGFYSELDASDNKQQQRSMICLMTWGSKFAHSCAPNMFLQYEPSENVMVFRAVRPLAPGTVLSFSYLPEDDMTLGGLVCGTTVLRQAKLRKFKFFECACTRCQDFDWSRGQDTIEKCQEVYYRQQHWECTQCRTEYPEEKISFCGERETHVQQMTLAFAALAHGLKPVDEDSLRMIEPYMEDLLHPEDEDEVPVPKHHWTFGTIHAVLATYHLKLFPQFFGKGLAERFGMVQKGLNEAVVYLTFLNDHIWSFPSTSSSSPGNPMTAFFAGWRILTIVMDSVLQGTQRTVESDSDDDCSSSEEEEDLQSTIELIPMPEDWKQPTSQMIDIVQSGWIPLVTQIFHARRSPVIDDMMKRINEFVDRVELVSAL
ncbi:hypothetical protein BDA99DRAFT_448428 [Phascolomyces articulosus]|uniref:SET domain-containing protein n=1 Tax=Phascolomyces articulosus TaxID=60185 RepID=A0AAD5JXM5_9FUNG|nr:hypothetical protein BDA99DRAFT_448428 [Phascolomyces articulosus]